MLPRDEVLVPSLLRHEVGGRLKYIVHRMIHSKNRSTHAIGPAIISHPKNEIPTFWPNMLFIVPCNTRFAPVPVSVAIPPRLAA
jgi:hypothetical protein